MAILDNGSLAGLTELASLMPKDSEAYRLSQAVDENSGTYRIDELYAAVYDAMGVGKPTAQSNTNAVGADPVSARDTSTQPAAGDGVPDVPSQTAIKPATASYESASPKFPNITPVDIRTHELLAVQAPTRASVVESNTKLPAVATPKSMSAQTNSNTAGGDPHIDPELANVIEAAKAGVEGRKPVLTTQAQKPISEPTVSQLNEEFNAAVEGRRPVIKETQPQTNEKVDQSYPYPDGLAIASLRFLSNRDILYQNMEKVGALDGYEDVVCHADPYSFAFQDPATGEIFQEATAKMLAEYIRQSGKYNGSPIRLIACESGAFKNGIAQQLADELGVVVLAPTKTVFVDSEGRMVVAEGKLDAYELLRKSSKQWDSSGWVIFKPKEND